MAAGQAASGFHTGSGNWEYLSVTVTPNFDDGGATTFIAVGIRGETNATSAWVDGVQLELKGYATTFCDGDQPGCEFEGAAHDSESMRSAQARSGGRVYDLRTDFSLDIGGISGAGMPPITQHLDDFALIPGGEVQSYKEHSRVLVLTGLLEGTSIANYHSLRQDLIDILSPSSVPENQEIVLRYTGAAVDKEISVRYEGGLEMTLSARDCSDERVAIRFLAEDPFWYEIGNTATGMDTRDTDTLRYITARLRTTGQWDDTGLTANPDGGVPAVYAIKVGPDGRVYVGGDFTGWDSVVGDDYCVYYDPTDGGWHSLGGAGVIDAAVRCIEIGPEGDVYIGGAFTTCGVANTLLVARYDVSAGAFVAVGVPSSVLGAPVVYAMAWDKVGDLLVGGHFTDFAGVAAADYFAKWDVSASAWVAVGIAGDGTGDVHAIAVDSKNYYAIGGAFLNWGGDANADAMAVWDGADWAANSAGIALSSTVLAMAMTPDDQLYLGGLFQNLGDIYGDYIALWNGTGFEPLGTGMGNQVNELVLGPDGVLYAGGTFTTAGGMNTYRIAKWNGSSWANLDLGLPTATGVGALNVGPADPVIAQNYDIWVGYTASAVGAMAGDTTITNNGTENARPTIRIDRSGGTWARLMSIRNETTGKELLFDYEIQDGESLYIYLEHGNQRIESSFWGKRMDALLPNSDFGTFGLQPGANLITAFVNVTGAPTMTTYALWRDTYASCD
jgi:hypothetical protein